MTFAVLMLLFSCGLLVFVTSSFGIFLALLIPSPSEFLRVSFVLQNCSLNDIVVNAVQLQQTQSCDYQPKLNF